MELANIEKAWGAKFGPPKAVNTARGPRLLRTAEPTQAFWAAWREQKAAIKSNGYGVGKDRNTGRWILSHWGEEKSHGEKQAAKAASRSTDAPFRVDLPDGLELMPFQRAGAKFLTENDNSLLADEMGLGKTIQVIAALNAIRPESVLIVVPAFLKLNWAKELAVWDTTGLPVHVINGGKHYDLPARCIAIVNYDVLKKHHALLRSRTWSVLVADEAHYAKNDRAQRTRELLGHSNRKRPDTNVEPIRAERKWLLTGTPITARPKDLFGLVHYLDPKNWPNAFKFFQRYCDAHHNGWGWDFSGASNLDELQDRLRSTIMVRRLKSEVLTELPAKVRHSLVLQPTSNGEKAAIKAEAEISGAIDELIAEGALDGATNKVLFEQMSKVRKATALAKLPKVIEYIRDQAENGKPLVVFGHHREIVEAITEAVTEAGYRAGLVYGGIDNAERQRIVDDFQAGKLDVFVGSIGAAGVGLTLTASSTVIFAELDWTPANLTQAEDRCHRIGATDSVEVIHLVLDGSIDARLAEFVVRKQNIMDAALDDRTEEKAPEAISVEVTPKPKTNGGSVPLKTETEGEITPEQLEILKQFAIQLDADNYDEASERNDIGYNRLDTSFGRSLAGQSYPWTSKQAQAAKKMLRKYRRQLDAAKYETVYG